MLPLFEDIFLICIWR